MVSRVVIVGCIVAFGAMVIYGKVDFNDPKVYGHIEALARQAQVCVIKTSPTPSDVRAYLLNKPVLTSAGECFVACMYEKFGIIVNGIVNRKVFIYLLTIMNGNSTRLIDRLDSVSQVCLDFIKDTKNKCQIASIYNDCLNTNLREFSFPSELADEIVRKMPYRSLANHADMMAVKMQYEQKKKILKNMNHAYY